MAFTAARHLETQDGLQAYRSLNVPPSTTLTPFDLPLNARIFIEVTLVHESYVFPLSDLEVATSVVLAHRDRWELNQHCTQGDVQIRRLNGWYAGLLVIAACCFAFVSSASYASTKPTATPLFSPAAGRYTTAQAVAISDDSSNATIYYTTNGTTPTTSSTKYMGPITVNATKTLKAMAVATGSAHSAIASADYAITKPAATPVFSPTEGKYTTVQSVIISDATAGATIYYTTNGKTPTTSSSQYTSPIA